LLHRRDHGKIGQFVFWRDSTRFDAGAGSKMNASRAIKRVRVVTPDERLEILRLTPLPWADTSPQTTELEVALVLPQSVPKRGENSFLKDRLAQFASELRRLQPSSRLAIISYGTVPGDIEMLGLTESSHELIEFLASIAPKYPVADEGAILAATRVAVGALKWRSNCKRVVVLFADTYPRKDDFKDILRLAHAFRSTGGTINTVYVTCSDLFGEVQAKAILEGIATIGGGSLIIADPSSD
jgi:von Willebrand factor type A domain-containing protein